MRRLNLVPFGSDVDDSEPKYSDYPRGTGFFLTVHMLMAVNDESGIRSGDI